MASVTLENKEFRYATLQVAVNHFGEPLNSLSTEKRMQAESIALKQYEIQGRVLSSPEACGVVISDEHINKAMQEVIGRYPSKDEFKQELRGNDLDLESFRYSVERELRVEAVMDIVTSSAVESGEVDARLYYYLHPEKFTQPETRDARHILITVNPDFPENSRENVIKRAGAIINRLRKKPARFGEQALKNSECPTAMDGGKLGRIKREVLYPELDEVLFNMKAGEVSDLVESPIGFHILFCENIYSEGLVPIQQAIPQIIEKLNDRNRKNRQREWLKKIMSD